MLKTAALIFVSDRFLNGENESTYSACLIKDLTALGYLVKKISVVEEHERIVTYELDILSKQFDIVIVVNELRNNIVFKALANVTSQVLTTNIKYKEVLSTIYGSNTHWKCLLPVAAKLLTGDDLTYPVIYVHRIFVLKEEHMEKSYFNILQKHLQLYKLEPKYTKVVWLEMNGNTKKILRKIENLNVNVSCKEEPEQLSVILESRVLDKIVECEKMLRDELENNFMGSFARCRFLDSIYGNSDIHIKQAIESIENCLKTYGPENVFVSFNGGKDCTVLLHLVYTVLSRKYPNYKGQIFCLYVKNEYAFPEQDKFISQCQVYFNLEVTTVLMGIKEALGEVLSKRPNFKACFMGTRRTDPFSNELKTFQMTDLNWPQIMRVSPLLDWHYSDIWDYLLLYKVPYCNLYDQGFTSLGNSLNTIRNPCLSYKDIYLEKERYLPAYKMLNESEERNGRNIRT